MAKRYRKIDSPIGELLLVGTEQALEVIEMPEGKRMITIDRQWMIDMNAFPEEVRQINEYFVGDRKVFELETRLNGTPFQLAVLDALKRIPYGQTASYQDIANAIGRPTAVRAVGAANGKNPLPILIPCHRVIGSDGSLTGFRGGLSAKRYLLDLEASESWFL